MAQRRGKGFGMRNPAVLSQTVDESPPAALVEEVNRNGEEAGGDTDIFQFRGGCTAVLDNGHGMSPVMMAAKLCDFGASGKTIGGEGNLGSGPKIYALRHSLEGVQFYSKQGDVCYVLEWGENPDGFGPLEQEHTPHERRTLEGLLTSSREVDAADRRRLSEHEEGAMRFVKAVDCPRELAGYQSGTLVVLRGVTHDQAGFLEWFNNRIVDPKKIVRIWAKGIHTGSPNPGPTTFTCVRGLMPCVRELCLPEQFGVVTLKTATVYWGIKRAAEDLAQKPVPGFSPQAFYRGWQNLCYRSIPHSGAGSSKLGRWGISFGGKRVVLVVIAKGRKIKPQPSRLDFIGWDEEEAIVEWQENFPEELEAYVEQAREDLPGPKDFDERVQDMVDRLLAGEGAASGAGGMKVGRIVNGTPKKNPFTRAAAGGGGSGSSAQKLGRGIRPILCENNDEMAGERIRLDGSWLKINIGHPDYKRELDRAKSAIRRNWAKMLIASEAVFNLIRTARELGINPTQMSPDTVKAATAGSILVRWYLNGGEERMHTPRRAGVR